MDLTKVPDVMDAQRWFNGARLLREWFSRAPTIPPGLGPPSTQIIKMDWVLGFARALSVYNRLIEERVWANPAAQVQVAAMLRAKGLFTFKKTTFDALDVYVPDLDREAVNYRAVNFGMGDLDDLTAALGNFVFKVAVAGELESLLPKPGFKITIRRVGVFVRDSFDFNDYQFLGYWNEAPPRVSMINPLAGDAVSNSSFRAWRAANGRGGDFLVFSDTKKTNLSQPDVFDVQ